MLCQHHLQFCDSDLLLSVPPSKLCMQDHLYRCCMHTLLGSTWCQWFFSQLQSSLSAQSDLSLRSDCLKVQNILLEISAVLLHLI